MKIALCFSGQPRFVKECAPYIIDNVIGNNDVDVFSHLWFDETLQTQPYKYGGNGNWINQRISNSAIDDFNNIYKPKKLITEPSKSFKNTNLYLNESIKRYWAGAINNPQEPNYETRLVNNCLSYFYSLNEVSKIKKLYEFENNFKYDFVVRCRTDSIVHTKINFSAYNPSVINYSNINNQPDNMICDWFNFGNSKIMDAFMGVFSVIDLIFDKCMAENNNAWCHELLHKKMIDSFNISSQGHFIHITLPRF